MRKIYAGKTCCYAKRRLKNIQKANKMSITRIRQLAQTKLLADCLQSDHNLLHIVGHVNLLQSLAIHPRDSEDQKRQELFAASNIKTDRLDAHPRQAYVISKKLYSF
jgi:hypothetical protein